MVLVEDLFWCIVNFTFEVGVRELIASKRPWVAESYIILRQHPGRGVDRVFTGIRGQETLPRHLADGNLINCVIDVVVVCEGRVEASR